MNEQTLFAEALERTGPGDRAAFLDQACRGDAALRARIERLLAQHESAGSFLESPPLARKLRLEEPSPECPGTVIGTYQLVQPIGEGGMGTVWMAQQTDPVKRLVALKIMKAGMDSKQVLARFEAERQALALMDHPNIARVFDVGAAPAGRPYFVMELVKGVPITQYCDEHRLRPRDRLRLFVSVCEAVQHAHQKGVIHRDLKPSNVLVAPCDGKPVVKVIDFGVAKATGQRLTEETLVTGFGMVVGTPEYMSPEQAALDNHDVDTRSDVYSLGVLLYELLTGGTPLTRACLKEASLLDVLRVIREEEPPRPSTRLLESKDTLPAIAARRQTDPAKLPRLVKGELDWIVLKALEKDRNRRYESASAFAADVQRYLREEPVLACPPSRWYRFRKFARRNRTVLAAATAVGLLALVTVFTLAVSNVRIREEQARTQGEKERAEQEKERAEKAQQLAEQRAEDIRKGLERLQAANALLERGRAYAADRHWDDAYDVLKKAIDLRPDHAAVWFERGELLLRLGLWDLAAEDLAREYELRPPVTTDRWHHLALLRAYVGDHDGYGRLTRRARKLIHGIEAPPHTLQLIRACAVAPAPDLDLATLVELARHCDGSRYDDGGYLYVLGMAHLRAGQHDQAVRRFQEIAAKHPASVARSLSHSLRAMAHHHQGQKAAARQALADAARAIDQWTQAAFEEGSVGWAPHLGATGFLPLPWWDWLEAQYFYREASVLIDGAPPADARLHVLRARALAGLRWSMKADEEYARALKLKPQDPQIRLEAHRTRGYICAARYQWRQAAVEFAQASDLRPGEVRLWQYRAMAYLVAGNPEGYRQACASMVSRFETTTGPEAAHDVVETCALRENALPDGARLLPLARVAATRHPGNVRVLGAALYRAGRYNEAVQCIDAAAQVYPLRASDWAFLAMAHHRLGHGEEARRCLDQAVHWIDAANGLGKGERGENGPAWGGFEERLTFPLLVREAKEIVGAPRVGGEPPGRAKAN